MKITTYILQVFISVFLYPFVKSGPKGASKPSKLLVLHDSESSSGLALANDIPREEWWDNNPALLITLQGWHILKVIQLHDHAVSSCYTFLCCMTSGENITYCFSLQDCWDFSIWALILPTSEADGICMQLNLSMEFTDIRSLETGVQHTPLNPLLIQSAGRQCDHFCTKMLHIFQIKTVLIVHMYLSGLALDCQYFSVLEL